MWDSVIEIGNEVPGPGEDRVETDSGAEWQFRVVVKGMGFEGLSWRSSG